MSITLTLDASFNIGQVNATTSSEDGAYMYCLVNNDGVYRSIDYGVSWSKTYSAASPQLTSITCSSDGSIVYFCWVGGGLFGSTDYGLNFTNIAGYASDLNLTPINGGPYVRTVACNADGKTVIVGLQTGSTYVYICTNFSSIAPNTNTWTSAEVVGPSLYVSNIYCNSDASILFAVVGPDNSPSGTNSNIYTSTNSGASWSILPGSFAANWASLACDFTGTKVYAIVLSVGLYIFSPSTGSPILISSPNTSAFGALATYSNGANLLTRATSYIYNYTLTYPDPICFKEDSKILCMIQDKEVYVPIQDIRKGTLVKTHLSGYVPVNMIGTFKFYNDANSLPGEKCLYKCPRENYSELTEDLIITGDHSILVDDLTDEEKKRSVEITGDIYVTENKYRLFVMLDDRAVPFQEKGVFSLWHLALDHHDDYMNYGIYANGGLLVETTSKRMLREYQGMNILN
jgi:hypothetical protein